MSFAMNVLRKGPAFYSCSRFISASLPVFKEIEVDSEMPKSPVSEDMTQKSETESFAKLLRNSTFIKMGDPVGKIVVGEIFHIVDNDLYIDFGWKFHTVCTVSEKQLKDYKLGSKVLLKIKDLELCTKFLGQDHFVNLLEADCRLEMPLGEMPTLHEA